jgi:hypothetical protein
MFYLLKTEDNKNIIIDRMKNRQVVLRSQEDGVVLPLLRSTNTKLSFIFSSITRKIENCAVGLDWYDTQYIIKNLLGEVPDVSVHKPSCIMYYNLSIAPSEDYSTITVEFKVRYNVWKRVVDEETSKPRFESVITEPVYFSYTFTKDEYKDFLFKINIYSETAVKKIMRD